MKQLVNERTNSTLAEQLEIASGVYLRMRGLMGAESLAKGHALWIPGCNWIHTGFMKFSIDAVFLNSKMEVVDIFFDVKPWKMCRPVFRARSVVEFQAGSLNPNSLRVGDKVYVGDPRT